MAESCGICLASMGDDQSGKRKWGDDDLEPTAKEAMQVHLQLLRNVGLLQNKSRDFDEAKAISVQNALEFFIKRNKYVTMGELKELDEKASNDQNTSSASSSKLEQPYPQLSLLFHVRGPLMYSTSDKGSTWLLPPSWLSWKILDEQM